MLLYLPKSAYPGLFHPAVKFSCVRARTQLYFWFFITRGCHPLLWLYTRRFQHKARHPPQELPYFSGNLRPAPPPHRRWQARSRLLPDQASHDYNLNFKLRSPAHPLEFRRSSLALAWLLLAAPVNTAQLALFSTTAVSVSLMFPGPENLHYSNLLY